MHIDKQCIYRLPLAINVARFCGKLVYSRSGVFLLISPRLHWLEASKLLDSQFKGCSWQRWPELKNPFQHIMLGFLVEGHIYADYIDNALRIFT